MKTLATLVLAFVLGIALGAAGILYQDYHRELTEADRDHEILLLRIDKEAAERVTMIWFSAVRGVTNAVCDTAYELLSMYIKKDKEEQLERLNRER